MDAPGWLPELLDEWHLRVTDQLEQGWLSHVVGVETEDGNPLILKLVDVDFDNGNLLNEITALELFQGSPIVDLLRSDRDRGAMLLERISPAQSLVQLSMDDDPTATAITADLIDQLRRPVPAQHPFRTAENLFDEFAAVNVKESDLPERLMERARSVFYELVESQDEFGTFLLHGDLHHSNILSSTNRWRVIDPDPVIADAAFEAAAFLRNPFSMFERIEHLDRFMNRRVDQLAEQLDDDRHRLKAWAFARTALSVSWIWTDRQEVHLPWLHCAEALRV